MSCLILSLALFVPLLFFYFFLFLYDSAARKCTLCILRREKIWFSIVCGFCVVDIRILTYTHKFITWTGIQARKFYKNVDIRKEVRIIKISSTIESKKDKCFLSLNNLRIVYFIIFKTLFRSKSTLKLLVALISPSIYF